jgi:hypothetical protein
MVKETEVLPFVDFVVIVALIQDETLCLACSFG